MQHSQTGTCGQSEVSIRRDGVDSHVRDGGYVVDGRGDQSGNSPDILCMNAGKNRAINAEKEPAVQDKAKHTGADEHLEQVIMEIYVHTNELYRGLRTRTDTVSEKLAGG